MELKFELCGSHLKRRPLFCICATLDLQIVQRICFNVVSFLLLALGDRIFLPGEGAAQVPAAGDHQPAAQHGWDYTIVLLAVLPFVLKVFIIVSLIAGLFISSSVVSTICTEMMTIRSQSKHATNKMKVLRRHLRQVAISPRLKLMFDAVISSLSKEG